MASAIFVFLYYITRVAASIGRGRLPTILSYMFRYFLSALMAVSMLFASAQSSDTNLTGHVVDASTGEHMPYYTIAIEGTSIGTTTDATGHYVLRNLTPGSYTVQATCVGYLPESKKVQLLKGLTTELNFRVSPDALQLEQVVVTGSKSEVKRRFSPTLVNVVDAKLFGMVNACSLADGLNMQPGVRVENDCQNCGFTQVRINGLDGHYSQVLMNSRPVFSALAGVYGLEQIPANMIDRVEVQRGGGSALFGSSAIGGTINVITKDPSVNSAQFAHSLTSMGISGALDNNTTVNASVVGTNNDLGMFLYGQNRIRDGYDHDGDGYTEIPTLRSQTLGARGNMRLAETSKLTMEYHATQEYRRGGDRLDLPPHSAMVAEEVDHNIQGGEGSFDWWNTDRNKRLNIFTALQDTKRKSYYGSEMDPNAYGRTTDLTVASGAQWTQKFSRFLFMPSEFVGGLEYSYNHLHDVTVGYAHDINQRVNVYSAYAQNEWRDERWGFLIGGRIDKHSLISRPIFSPRANIRFTPSDKISARLSYSTGFRSPQAYEEDFHIAIVGGERLVTVLAPGLRPESSQSISGSVDLYHRIGDVQANFMIEGFFTDLKDVFALRLLDQIDAQGNIVQERFNGSGARVGGVNLESRFAHAGWSAQGGLTWQRSRYKEPLVWSENPEVPAETRMFRTPDLYGYLTGSYNITHHMQVALSGTYTGEMLVQHLAGSGTEIDTAVRTPRFFDLNAKVSYSIPLYNASTLRLSAGIMNIFNSYQRDFDRGALRDSGYIYGPSLPRSLNFSATLDI